MVLNAKVLNNGGKSYVVVYVNGIRVVIVLEDSRHGLNLVRATAK